MSDIFGSMFSDAMARMNVKQQLINTQTVNHVFNGRIDEALSVLDGSTLEELQYLRTVWQIAAQIAQCSMDGKPIELLPEQWQKMPWCEYTIHSADGWMHDWRGNGPRIWDVPITKEEFLGRMHNSTIEKKR